MEYLICLYNLINHDENLPPVEMQFDSSLRLIYVHNTVSTE